MKARPSKLTAKTDLVQIADLLRSMLQEERDEEAIEMVIELLRAVKEKNTELELRLQKLLKQHYGRKREGITNSQLSLFLEQIEDKTTESNPDPEDNDEIEQEIINIKGHERKIKKRRPLPEHLEKQVHIHHVEGEDRQCTACGNEKSRVRFESSSCLDFVPAKFIINEHQFEIVACKNCDDGIVMAQGPQKLITGGIPGAGLLAEILVNKYRDGLPLNRQMHRFSRLGVDLARSTMSDWVGYCAHELRAIANLIMQRVLSDPILMTDGTGIDVLDKKHPANIRKGAFYCHLGSKEMFFIYGPNQSKETPQKILEHRQGYIVLDAASVYDGLFSKPDSKAIEVGCNMHARRYFIKALDAGDFRAAIAVKYYKRLYKIEKLAKVSKMGAKRRLRLRRNKSQQILNKLKSWIDETYNLEPPKTPLYKALNYARNHWEALTRFANDGRLPIDNGAVERAIKMVAIGRKNYLFVGSDTGGERAAIIYTIIGSCALAGVNPWEYLKDVLDKIANGWPANRLPELLPIEWKKTQSVSNKVA